VDEMMNRAQDTGASDRAGSPFSVTVIRRELRTMPRPFVRALHGLVVALCALLAAPPAFALRGLKEGTELPAFSVDTLAGQPVTRDTYKGKVLLLLFVRPQQDYSVTALQAADELLKKNAGSNLAVLAVATREDPSGSLAALAAQKGLTLDIALDPARRLYSDMGVIVSPTALFIDPSGMVRFVVAHLPQGYPRRLQAHADLLLGKITASEHGDRLALATHAPTKDEQTFAERLALGRLLTQAGDTAQALTVLTALKEQKPDAVAVAAALGMLYLRQGKVDAAAAELGRLSRLDPVPTEMTLAQALLAVQRGDAEAAQQQLAEVSVISEERSRVLFALGQLHERQKHEAQALACYRLALDGVFPTAAGGERP
jgi:peroxiredoxin/Flp pilus assembly protein TadD